MGGCRGWLMEPGSGAFWREDISTVRLQGEELEKQGWGWRGARGLQLSAVGALH